MIEVAVATGIVAGSLGCAESPAERRARIYDLREDPSPANLERIRSRLTDADRDVRATALFALASLHTTDAGASARAALETDGDGFVRATAAKVLGDLEARDATPSLIDHLLEDPDPVVRQRCAEVLALFGGEAARDALVQALDDPLERVRRAAVTGVASLDSGPAMARLARIVTDDPEWEIRAQAAHGLGRSGRPEARDPLRVAMADPNEFVRAAAAAALEELDRDVR